MKINVLFHKVLHLGRVLFTFGISAIARCLPIKNNCVVLFSIPDFSDNAWVLYKYMKETRKDLDIYWVASDAYIHPDIDSSKVIRLTLSGFIHYYWTVYRAKYIFSTHSFKSDSLNRKRQININLNHGPCPIKGAKGNGIVHPNKNFKKRRCYDYILCRGNEAVPAQAEFNCCESQMVLPLGMARDDVLIKNIGSLVNNPFYNGISLKLVIWMPTFRKSIDPNLSEDISATATGLPLMETEDNIFFLDDFLKNNDIQLLIKIHPLQKDNPTFKKKFSNITIITNEDLNKHNKQLYEIIGYTDALITDYSSVYFDYLLTDKPVGFILDDYDRYIQDRGFVIENPKRIMAGHHIYDISQFTQFFLDVKDGNDEYNEKRQKIKQLYIENIPECTCEKILDYFKL